jgi:hypothetical protein
MIKIREEKTDDMFLILSDDYHIPLWGDYRGVELARIRYGYSMESREYARKLANKIKKYLEEAKDE